MGGYIFPNILYGVLGFAVVKTVTRYAKVEFSPISIRFLAINKHSVAISACFFHKHPSRLTGYNHNSPK